MPLRTDCRVAQMCLSPVADHSPVALSIEGVLHLPVRVARQVLSCSCVSIRISYRTLERTNEELLAPGQTHHLPSYPEVPELIHDGHDDATSEMGGSLKVRDIRILRQ